MATAPCVASTAAIKVQIGVRLRTRFTCVFVAAEPELGLVVLDAVVIQ